MPHEIAIINGRAAHAYNILGGLPWHQLGRPVDGIQSGEDMAVAANLDWSVLENELTFALPDPDRVDETLTQTVPDYKALTRGVDGHYLATVRKTYKPIQNEEMFSFAEALMGEGVKFETAGALYDGRVVWALAVVEDLIIRVDGDDSPILPYMVLTTGHDSLHAFRVKNSPTRVVCANTLDAALKGEGREAIIRHTKTAPDRIAVAKAAKKIGIAYFDAFQNFATQLSAKKMTLRDVTAFTEKLIPTAPDAERTSKSDAQRAEIMSIIQHADNLADMDLTGWKVYNAVGQWADHSREYRDTKLGSSQDARALAILDGTAQKIKDSAVSLLLPVGRGTGGRFARVA